MTGIETERKCMVPSLAAVDSVTNPETMLDRSWIKISLDPWIGQALRGYANLKVCVLADSVPFPMTGTAPKTVEMTGRNLKHTLRALEDVLSYLEANDGIHIHRWRFEDALSECREKMDALQHLLGDASDAPFAPVASARVMISKSLAQWHAGLPAGACDGLALPEGGGITVLSSDQALALRDAIIDHLADDEMHGDTSPRGVTTALASADFRLRQAFCWR